MIGLAAGAAGYGLLALLVARAFRPASSARLRPVETKDGWRLSLAEYPGPANGPAVYLQHGLGACHLNFDLHPHGPSLARWLGAQGFRVFVGNLRGRAGGAPPAGKARTWRFSDYLLRDVPALAAAVSSRIGGKFHWVGHSLGGILGLAHAARAGAEQLLSVTTLGSALHYGVGASGLRRLLPLRPALALLPKIPSGWAHGLWAPMAALGLPDPWHYRRENLDASTAIAFHAHGQADITLPELLELATTFSGEGILCEELGARLPALARRLPVPWLCVAGSKDNQCPLETADWTYRRVDAPRKLWAVAGRSGGLSADYGHYDLVAGRRAPEDIWTRIAAFIRETENPASPA